MSRIEGVILVLVETEIAQHEVGHRLIEITEEQHLALQVLVPAEQAQQAIAGPQPGEELVVIAIDQN